MLFGCEADPECLRVAREAVIGEFAKAAFNAQTDIGVSGEAAEAAVKTASLVPKMATADALYCRPDGLLL